jgi:hypothetical protein
MVLWSSTAGFIRYRRIGGQEFRVERDRLRDGSYHLRYYYNPGRKLCLERINETTGWYAVGQPDSHQWQISEDVGDGRGYLNLRVTGRTIKACLASMQLMLDNPQITFAVPTPRSS